MSKQIVEAVNTSFSFQFDGDTAELRLYPTQAFVTSDGQLYGQGQPFNEQSWYLPIPCEIQPTGILYVPSFEIDSTTDGQPRTAKYIAALFSEDGAYLGPMPSTNPSGFAIPPPEIMPAPTWGQLAIYNRLPTLLYPPVTFPTRDEMYAAIAAAIGEQQNASSTNKGVTALDVDPDDPTFPIAVGVNSPLLGTTDASATVAGITRLTVDPDVPTIPIAVGANDPEWLSLLNLTVFKSSDYASLNDAVTTIGATQGMLLIESAMFPSGATCDVPTTLILNWGNVGSLDVQTGQRITVLSSADTWPGRQVFVEAGVGKATFGSAGINPADPIRPLTREINPVWWCAGTGTEDDPFTGWEEIFTAFCKFRFPAGWFETAAQIDWSFMCLEVEGAGKSSTILKYTGTDFYGLKIQVIPSPILYGQVIGNFSLHGNAAAHNGIVVDLTASSRYHDIQIQDFPEIKFIVGFAIVSEFENIFAAPASTIHPETVPAERGFAWGWDSIGHNMTSSVVTACWAEACTVAGMRFNDVLDCTFIGGTSENNGTGIGIEIFTGTQMNTFISMDLEGNPGGDIICQGGGGFKNNTFKDMLSTGLVNHIDGLNNRFTGGMYNDVTLGVNGLAVLDGIQYGSNGGVLTDNSVNTIYMAPLLNGISPVLDLNSLQCSLIKFGTTTTVGEPRLIFGTGSPEGVETAVPGSIYLNKTGGANVSVYFKESGSGANGWIGK